MVSGEAYRLQWCAVLGVVSFMVSDGILAYNRYVDEISGAEYVVMVLYYFALSLIAESVPVAVAAPL